MELIYTIERTGEGEERSEMREARGKKGQGDGRAGRGWKGGKGWEEQEGIFRAGALIQDRKELSQQVVKNGQLPINNQNNLYVII